MNEQIDITFPKILGLTLSTKPCWAIMENNQILSYGSIFCRKDANIIKMFSDFLYDSYKKYDGIDMVVFEERQLHYNNDCKLSFDELLGEMLGFCIKNNIPFRGVPQSNIKKFLGNTTLKEFGKIGLYPKTKNEAIAIAAINFISTFKYY